MKRWILLIACIAILVVHVAAQANVPTLPQAWVNNNEANSFAYELTLGSNSWVGSAPPVCSFTLPYLVTSAGLQSAINALEVCRTLTGVGIALDIPTNVYSFSGTLTLPQSSSTLATNPIVLRSTADGSLPNGQTVCSHGIQDNVASATNPGLENADCAGDNLSYQLGTTVTSLGLTLFSLDDLNDSLWQQCSGACAGGNNPTFTSQTFNNTSPARDGFSQLLTMTGPSGTNNGWFHYYGVQNSNTNFTLDGWFYVPSTTNVQALEFDQFMYLLTGHGGATQNTRLYFGTECDIGATWQIWDSFVNAWVNTGVPCVWTSATFHHLIIRVHRVSGDTSGTSNYPLMYYDLISLDGATVISNRTTSAGTLPVGWAEQSGTMIQLDSNSTSCGASCTLTESIDTWKGSAFQGPITLANGTNVNATAYNDSQYMWTVETTGTNKPALQTCSPLGASSISIPPACVSTTLAPDHWLIEDMQARLSVGNKSDTPIVSLVENGNESSTTQFPSHIHFRKDWISGDWTTLTAGANSVSSGILLNCLSCSVVDSQISQVLRPGAEGHSLGGRWGSQFKVDHNWLEGSASGFFCGGFTTPPSVSGLVPCRDVELRRNRFTFPYTWLGQNDSTCGTHGVGTVPHTNPYWGCTSSTGYSLVRKNSWEIKEGQRIVASGNIFENSDNSGGQGGVLIVNNIRNSSGVTYAGSSNYQSVISDLTFQSNIVRNGCEGMEMGSSNSSLGNGGGVSFLPVRVSLANDLIYNVTTSNPGCTGVNSTGLTFSSGMQQWKGTITENAGGTQATFVATCSVDGGDCPAGPPSIGFQVTDINPGDAVSISGCTGVTSFNAPTQVISGHTVPAGIGPLATGATNPASLTVVYPWTAAANAQDNSGNCILTKVEGGPSNLSLSHLTFVTDTVHSITSNNILSNGPNFALNSLIQNSLILGGGLFNNPLGEGTPTETYNYDSTSFTIDHDAWPTRTSGSYTAYGNNPFFLTASPVLYFPTTAYCSGASPTSTCVGFTGAMSASSMPLTLTDYHNFSLISGSIFRAGGADQATDGTDLGVNISTLDTAQTQNLYVCSYGCGSPGPFPDLPIGTGGFSITIGTGITTGVGVHP